MIKRVLTVTFMLAAVSTGAIAVIGAMRDDGLSTTIMGVGRLRSQVSGYLRLQSRSGTLFLFYQRPDPAAAAMVERKIDLAPIAFLHIHGNWGYFTFIATAHSLVVISLLLFYPCFTVARHYYIRRKRRAGGLCIKCGYSLRGINTAKCPECGAGFSPPATSCGP